MKTQSMLGFEGASILQLVVLNTVNRLSGGVYAIEADDDNLLETVKREFHEVVARNRFTENAPSHAAYNQISEDGKTIIFGVCNTDAKVDESYPVVQLPVELVEQWVLPHFRLNVWVAAVLKLYPGEVEIKSYYPEEGFSIEEYDAARECFEKVLCEKSGCSPDHISNHHGSGSKEGVGSAYYCYPSNSAVEVPDDELLFWYRAYQQDVANQPK